MIQTQFSRGDRVVSKGPRTGLPNSLQRRTGKVLELDGDCVVVEFDNKPPSRNHSIFSFFPNELTKTDS